MIVRPSLTTRRPRFNRSPSPSTLSTSSNNGQLKLNTLNIILTSYHSTLLVHRKPLHFQCELDSCTRKLSKF
ncbi:hypothetical protein BLOT_007373 [Blomia tropicalis]|nr:hypothetical protein BLOT_007373 [Blomia tropicalis]